jgi:amino acid transporter
MASNTSKESDDKPFFSNKRLIPLLAILAFSLATWSAFYLQSMPLTLPETTVVVVLWSVVVFAARGIWVLLKKKGYKSKHAPKP